MKYLFKKLTFPIIYRYIYHRAVKNLLPCPGKAQHIITRVRKYHLATNNNDMINLCHRELGAYLGMSLSCRNKSSGDLDTRDAYIIRLNRHFYKKIRSRCKTKEGTVMWKNFTSKKIEFERFLTFATYI